MKKLALISVYDKEGIVEFAKELVQLGYGLLSTGGTYRLLKESGLELTEVSELTAFPEMLDGRVKSLHPRIHAGILYRRQNESDLASLKEHDIPSIDIVVNNLYPFEDMLQENKDLETMIENIDIGGPSMIRAAAKNYKDVLVVTKASDYELVIEKLRDGTLDLAFRQEMAAKAFSQTAYYDALISNYFNDLNGVSYPDYLSRPLKLANSLRYGENPHQSAAYYIEGYQKQESRFDFVQLHGKELSYNNLNDLTGTVEALKEFDRPTAVAVKHTNPSGIGSGDTIDEAFDKAYACDRISIFGGIIALNRPVTSHIANELNQIFVEIVIAPAFEEEAFKILSSKKNIRLIESKNLMQASFNDLSYKDVINGVLVQERDSILYDEEKFKVVSKRQPSKKELDNMLFGIKASKHINSNGVVLVKDEATISYGFGEVRRSWAVEKAIDHAQEPLDETVLVSDGFFFEDTVELMHENGIKAAVSPGGSIHDEKVLALCDEYDIALVFTGTRHFKH